MKITGITAEYNPLHNGHVYHIEETRRRSGCDVLVVAMSGDFVQRGEPAIMDKWLRAEHALDAGADLVVEIPTLFCLGNASQYAGASVKILEALGCDSISFGSESGDTGVISNVAGFLSSNRERIESYIASTIKEGKSYPAARYEAYRSLREGEVSSETLECELSVLSDPNDILALEYIRNMRSSRPLVIKREGAYHGDGDQGEAFLSAEYIRSAIKENKSAEAGLPDNVPAFVAGALAANAPVFHDDCFDLLKYAIISADPGDIDDCPSGGEGLGNLLKASVKEAKDYNDLVLKVKSKRYTYTRISRLCMQVLLGISRERYDFSGPGYIRVLGHNEKGRELLAHYRKKTKADASSAGVLPVITNINKVSGRLERFAIDQLGLDIHASEIYALISGQTGSDHAEQRKMPVMKK